MTYIIVIDGVNNNNVEFYFQVYNVNSLISFHTMYIERNVTVS